MLGPEFQAFAITTQDCLVLGNTASAVGELLAFATAAIFVMSTLIGWIATLTGAEEAKVRRYERHGFALGILVLAEILILQFISQL
jgi:hypothetical protein